MSGLLIEIEKGLNGQGLGRRVAAGAQRFREVAHLNHLTDDFERWQRDASAAFDVVAPKPNWKMPIDVVISEIEPERAGYIAAAVGHFTGADAAVHVLSASSFRFVAPGYYATVGA